MAAAPVVHACRWQPAPPPARVAARPRPTPCRAARPRSAALAHAACRARRLPLATRCRAASGDAAAAPDAAALEAALAAAIAAEDYARCAALRDELAALRAADPVAQTQRELAEAVAAERWQDAARLRDTLAAMLPPPPPPPPLVPCSSVCTTAGVRVAVRSEFMREHSDLTRGAHAFAYYVTFTNESSAPVQLLGRRWVITDASGRVEHVRGPGVVGTQPRLRPGESYSYSSFCPLRTPSGTMHGAFEFTTDAEGTDEPPLRFAVRVERFGLDIKGKDVPLPPGAEEADATVDAGGWQA